MYDISSEDKTKYNTTTYEGRRMLNKNGLIAGTFLFFKSTMGLGFLINQYFQGKSGFLLGNVLTLMLCFLVAYYSDIMLQIANKIESQSKRKIQIDSFDYVAGYVWGDTLRIIAKIFIILYNQSMIIVNTTNLSKFLQIQILQYSQKSFLFNIDYYKFFVILSFLVILLFILEPEKLKYLSYFATFVLILALFLMWILNFQKYISWEKKPYWEYYNFIYASDLIGNQLYSLESVGTLFTVRSTLRYRRKMRDVLKYAYGIILIIFFLNGVTFLFTYGTQGLMLNAFDYFTNTSYLLFLEWLFYLTIPCVVIIALISNSVEFENLEIVQKTFLKNEIGQIVISRLMIFRIFVCFLLLFPNFLIENEIYIMVISGTIVVPMVGFIIPILCDFKYNFKKIKGHVLFFKLFAIIIVFVINFYSILSILTQPNTT